MSGPHDTYVWFDPESIEGRFKLLEDELDDICFPKPVKVTYDPVIYGPVIHTGDMSISDLWMLWRRAYRGALND